MSSPPLASDANDSRAYVRLESIAVLAIFLVGFGIPLYSLHEHYVDEQTEIQRLADIQAVIIGRYASANPDSWMFKAEHLDIHLKGIRPEDTKSVIEYEDKPIIELGRPIAGRSMQKATLFSVHGKSVGRVRVVRSINHFVRDSLFTIGLGVLATVLLWYVLYRSVIRPLATSIRERERLRADLATQAQTDFLTGVANRREFVRHSELAIRAAIRYNECLSLLMLDIDHFKIINDEYGHKAGDIALIHLSETVRPMLRDVDLFGRIGGEEFAILLPKTSGEDAFEVADRLRQRLANEVVTIPDGKPLRFTVSIGGAELTRSDLDLDSLLGRADQALYQAKSAGRNKVCLAEMGPPGNREQSAQCPQSVDEA